LDKNGRCDTNKEHSSQALAIDVFGTLKAVRQQDRDAVLGRLADRLGLPAAGPWCVDLEWTDTLNHMCEKRSKTQIDAVARSPECLVFFECKFTEEDGGRCSQTKARSSGANKGLAQCNGNHEMQTNPINNSTARCALSSKGIRYWEIIPEVLDYRSEADYRPCPFAGPWFQWMRNLTCCKLIADKLGLTPAVVLTYAEGPGLPMAEKITGKRSADWTTFTSHLRAGAPSFQPISFQQFVSLAMEAVVDGAGNVRVWQELEQWVMRKIANA
jgi:hypothetical protein